MCCKAASEQHLPKVSKVVWILFSWPTIYPLAILGSKRQEQIHLHKTWFRSGWAGEQRPAAAASVDGISTSKSLRTSTLY